MFSSDLLQVVPTSLISPARKKLLPSKKKVDDNSFRETNLYFRETNLYFVKLTCISLEYEHRWRLDLKLIVYEIYHTTP